MKVGDLVRVRTIILKGKGNIGLIVSSSTSWDTNDDIVYYNVLFSNGAVEFFHHTNVEVISECR